MEVLMYPRMHKICGVSIEEFITRLHSYIMGEYLDEMIVRKDHFLNLYEFIESGDPTIEEDDLVECMKAWDAYDNMRVPLDDLDLMFVVYSHSDEYKKLEKSLHLDSFRCDAICNMISEDDPIDVNAVKTIFIRTASRLELLDQDIDKILERHPDADETCSDIQVRAFNRWRIHNKHYVPCHFNPKFHEIFHIDPRKFCDNVYQELLDIRDFIDTYTYQFDADVKMMAIGRHIPKDVNSLLQYYITFKKYIDVRDISNMASDYVSRKFNVSAVEAIDKYDDEVRSHGYDSYEYFSEILFSDKLHLGYIDSIKLAKSITMEEDRDLQSLFAVIRLNADVTEYMNSRIPKGAYDDFYREYLYASKEKMHQNMLIAKNRYQFLNSLCGFSQIPADRFKSVFAVADQYIDNIDTRKDDIS